MTVTVDVTTLSVTVTPAARPQVTVVASGAQGPEGIQGDKGDPGTGIPAAIGTDGQVFVADSTQPSGTRWSSALDGITLGLTTPAAASITNLNYQTIDVSSDGRLKRDIQPLGSMAKLLAELTPVRYRRSPEGRVEMGFLAQDVKRVFPAAIGMDKDGFLTLHIMDLLAVLAKAMQEHETRLSKLEGRGFFSKLMCFCLVFCIMAAGAQAQVGHIGAVSISATTIGPSGTNGSLTLTPSLVSSSAGGIVSATFGYFRNISGSGAGITNISASALTGNLDRIVSGTTSVIANSSTNVVSITTAGAVSSYFNTTGLTTAAISASGVLNVGGAVSASLGVLSGGLLTAAAGVSVTGAVTLTTTLTGATLISTSAGGIVTATVVNAKNISGTSIAGTITTAAQPNITSLGTLTSISDSGVLNVAGAVSMSSGVFSGGLLTAGAGVSASGYITASTAVSAPTVSATGAGLYTTNISASGASLVNTISSTGQVSASSTYTNYIREGVLAVNATTATTMINLGLATMISTTISSNTTISFTGANFATAQVVVHKICQDSTGTRTLNYPTNTRFNTNTSPTLTTTGSTCTVLTYTPLPGSANILVTAPATGVSN